MSANNSFVEGCQSIGIIAGVWSLGDASHLSKTVAHLQTQYKIMEQLALAKSGLKYFRATPFLPTLVWRNRHLQTIASKYLHKKDDITFRRHRVDTPDDDFIDLDFACVAGFDDFPDTTPITLVLHGYGGHARKGYAYETYRQLAQHGIRGVGMNFRSCSGEINRQPQIYHAGATDDVSFIVDWLHDCYPQAAIGIIAFSIGGNLLLKYLGESERSLVSAAATISAPFDMRIASTTLSNSIYNNHFTSYLKKEMSLKSHQIAHLIDIEEMMATKTVYDFDDVCLAPLHGFKNAVDYYEQTSSGQFLPYVQTPTLFIRSFDDPVLGQGDLAPYMAAMEQNPCLQPLFTKYGGHAGFAERAIPQPTKWWAQKQAVRFLQTYLQED